MRVHVYRHTQTDIHTNVILVKCSGVDVDGHLATEAGRKRRGEGSSICAIHVSRAPPVPAHHVSDSTDLLAHRASVCIVCRDVCRRCSD